MTEYKWKYSNQNFETHMADMKYRADRLRLNAATLNAQAEILENERERLLDSLEEIKTDAP